MANDLQLVSKDPIVQELWELRASAEQDAMSALNKYIQLGKRLKEEQHKHSREKGGSGDFLNWIKNSVKWNQSYVYKIIDIFEAMQDDPSLPYMVNWLPIGAWVAITAKNVSKETRTEVLEKAKDNRLTEKQVKQMIAEAKAKAKEETGAQYEAQIEQHVATIKELEQSANTLEAQLSVEHKKKIDSLQDRMNRLETAMRTKNEEHAAAVKELREKNKDNPDKLKQELMQYKMEKLKLERELQTLQHQLEQVKKNPFTTTFGEQINTVTEQLVRFIQHDELCKKLSNLEGMKEDIHDEIDMHHLERVIEGLKSLARRAEVWSIQLTPTNHKWKYRSYRPYEKEVKS
jgi:hypothetical protein